MRHDLPVTCSSVQMLSRVGCQLSQMRTRTVFKATCRLDKHGMRDKPTIELEETTISGHVTV